VAIFSQISKIKNIYFYGSFHSIWTLKILERFSAKFKNEKYYFMAIPDFTPFFTLKILGWFPKNFKNEKIFILYYFLAIPVCTPFLLWKYLGGFQKFQKWENIYFILIFWLCRFVLHFFSENTWVVSKISKMKNIYFLFKGLYRFYSVCALEILESFSQISKMRNIYFILKWYTDFTPFLLWKYWGGFQKFQNWKIFILHLSDFMTFCPKFI
jgi:hypothetical protein